MIAAAKKWVAGARPEGRGLRAPRARSAVAAPVHNVVDVELLEAGAGVEGLPRPRRGRRASCATGATACPTRSNCSRSRGRRAPARPAGGGPGRELLHRARGGRGRRSSPRSKPADQYIDFVRGETMKALDPLVKKAIADGQPIKFTTAGRRRGTSSRTSRTDDLLKMERTPRRVPGTAVPPGRARRVPPRGARGPGEAARRSRELHVLLDAIQAARRRRGHARRASRSTWSGC